MITRTPRLATSIEHLYAVFARPVPDQIPGCLCISESCACGLLAAPLRDLDGTAFYSYAHSVLFTVGSGNDLLYFWPRMLEWSIENGPTINLLSVLRKPALAEWRVRWAPEQQAATEHVFREIIESLASTGATQDELDWDLFGDLGAETAGWVEGISQSVEELGPILAPLTTARPAHTLAALSSEIQRGGDLSTHTAGPLRLWLEDPTVAAAVQHAWKSAAANLTR